MKKDKKPTRGPRRSTPINAAVDEWSKEALERALVVAHGNVTHAAEALGLAKSQAFRLLKRFDLVEDARKLRASVPGASPTGKGRQYTPNDRG